MNTYELDDKIMDQEFLDGKTVTCKAVVRESESGELKSGARIVVLLSTGKKYMGEIMNFRYVVQKGYAAGTLEVVRFPRKAR